MIAWAFRAGMSPVSGCSGSSPVFFPSEVTENERSKEMRCFCSKTTKVLSSHTDFQVITSFPSEELSVRASITTGYHLFNLENLLANSSTSGIFPAI